MPLLFALLSRVASSIRQRLRRSTMTQKEKIELIGKENAIDTHDAFGKYLVLNEILKSMGEEKANKFMEDTLMMLDDEVNDLFISYGFTEDVA